MAALLKKLKEKFGYVEYKIDVHYRPSPQHQNRYFLPIEILKGPYTGVFFSFENVNWNRVIGGMTIQDGNAQTTGDNMIATYDLVALNDVNWSSINTKKPKFRKVADDIWVDYAAFIFENHNKLKEKVLKDNTEEYPDEEYRNDDIEEFVGPRGIRKEGSAVPAKRVRTKQKRTSSPRSHK